MPITVVIRSDQGASETRLTFDGMQRVVMGRGAGCDVRLPDTTVSHRHASLRTQGADYVIFDEGSTNGTFVGGARIAPGTSRIARSGDMVRLGRVWIELRIDQGPVTRDLAGTTRDLALALVSRALAAHGVDLTTSVRVVEGPDQGAVLPLHHEDRAYTLGRAAHCDLPLADEDASREHARIVRRGKLVFVRDLSAKNGTWVGETRAQGDREWVWRGSQMLRVGRTILALEEPVTQALAKIESAPDEAIDPVAPIEHPEADAPPGTPSNALRPGGVDAPADAAPAVDASARGTPAAPSLPAAAATARRFWSVADLIVMAAAVGMLALSIAGLVWLLR